MATLFKVASIGALVLVSSCAAVQGEGRNGQTAPTRIAEFNINLYSEKERTSRPVPLAALAHAALQEDCITQSSEQAPYADIFFFRSPGALALTPDDQKQLTAALMSGDGPFALEATRDMRAGGDAVKRFTANIVVLYAWATGGRGLNAPDLKTVFDSIEADSPSMPKAAQADVYYLNALRAIGAGRKDEALALIDNAVLAESAFFNALVLRLALVIDQAEQQLNQSGYVCREDDRLVEALKDIIAISPCALQAAHLGLYLRSRQVAPDNHFSLLLTELFLSTISKQKATFEAKSKKLLALAEQRPRCKSLIVQNISELRLEF